MLSSKVIVYLSYPFVLFDVNDLQLHQPLAGIVIK